MKTHLQWAQTSSSMSPTKTVSMGDEHPAQQRVVWRYIAWRRPARRRYSLPGYHGTEWHRCIVSAPATDEGSAGLADGPTDAGFRSEPSRQRTRSFGRAVLCRRARVGGRIRCSIMPLAAVWTEAPECVDVTGMPMASTKVGRLRAGHRRAVNLAHLLLVSGACGATQGPPTADSPQARAVDEPSTSPDHSTRSASTAASPQLSHDAPPGGATAHVGDALSRSASGLRRHKDTDLRNVVAIAFSSPTCKRVRRAKSFKPELRRTRPRLPTTAFWPWTTAVC